MKARVGAVALATGLALAACASDPRPAPSPVRVASPRPSAPAQPEPPAVEPAAYFARAASYDQLMIRAAELAGQRSTDPRLLTLARGLGEEHRGLAAQLSLAGRRINLLPSPTLQPRHQAWLDEVAAAPDFALAWRRVMRRVHQNSCELHDRFAKRGQSPTLKLVARNAAATERRHWAELER